MMRRKSDKLDSEISRAWARLAHGVQVNVLDIPTIFRDVRVAVGDGEPLDDAIKTAIAKYRKN